MQGRHLFEYAVIRIVPRVEREEFLNAGVILYSKELNYLKCSYRVDRPRLSALCHDLDCDEVEAYLEAFDRICRGDKTAGPISLLDLPGRFRWLTATRSTVVQTSGVHPGFCDDPDARLEQLMEKTVL